MHQVWTLLIAAALLGVAGLVLVSARGERLPHPVVGIGLGASCGLAAALVILQPRIDLVPDEYEALGVMVGIVLVSLALIVITWLRWFRG